MNEDRSRNAAVTTYRQPGSWLDRLSQTLMNKTFSSRPKDRDQLTVVLRDAQKHGLLDSDALTMIEGVLTVSDMQVRDVMIPRSQMIVVEETASPETFLPVVVESAHSRFPVMGDTRDEIIGILLAKDLLAYIGERDAKSAEGGTHKFDLRDMLRPVVFIPESKRLNVLLKDFRANRNHMAVVVDEYGGVSGLVTIEDVLEQIVGDIEDEHDFEDDVFIVKHSDTQFTVKALTPVDDFNEYFEASLSDDEFDTIGGLLMQEFGRMPERDEKCQIGRYDFKVLRADSRRIHLLQMNVLDANTETADAGASADAAPDASVDRLV
ncbi:MAG: CBS domain-containing protein [Ectothiorhodospiraceae bacterium]|nr:CBS domain-containing protein [Ectothiorhodospiraceae bacterium]